MLFYDDGRNSRVALRNLHALVTSTLDCTAAKQTPPDLYIYPAPIEP
jgi:hypothetical protein